MKDIKIEDEIEELLAKYSRLEHCVRAYKEASEEFDDATNSGDHKAIDKAMINLYERKEQMYEALKNVENLTTNLEDND